MADSVSPSAIASIHHTRSRSLSPSKASALQSFACFGASNGQNGFEDIILEPPVAFSSYPQLRAGQAPDELDPALKQSGPHQPIRKQSFLEKYKLPPLITRSSGSGVSSPSPRSTVSLSATSIGKTGPESQCSPSSLPQSSPTRERWTLMPTLTGDKSGVIKVEDKGGKLADWFNGSSEVVNLGVLPSSTKEEDEISKCLSSSTTTLHPYKLHRKVTSDLSVKPASPAPSRFPFFISKASAPEPHPISSVANDKLINLDIRTALFPGGPADPFSPSSFHNLLTNAEGLLQRLQTAYKMRTISLHEITSENSGQQDELEEAEMRAQHLKLQLDDMAAKVAEKDEALKGLAEELATERQRRRHEEEARKRSILLASKPRVKGSNEGAGEYVPDRRSTKRDSNLTVASDSGFESEDDSSAGSVFSRTHETTSPSTPMSSVSGTTSPESYQQAGFPSVTSTPQLTKIRPGMGPQRPSTFQKILKGLSVAKGSEVADADIVRSSCANCQGGNAAEAWSVVGVLKDENEGLKKRVGDLEGAVEGCLDIVGGLRS